jgi:hypothetical protein
MKLRCGHKGPRVVFREGRESLPLARARRAVFRPNLFTGPDHAAIQGAERAGPPLGALVSVSYRGLLAPFDHDRASGKRIFRIVLGLI